ncbi:MAG: bifunctional diguanylate cyclase/phosphodiesterase [Trichloromonadaceae bacterium]
MNQNLNHAAISQPTNSQPPRRLRSFGRSLTTRFGLLMLGAVALFALGYLQFGVHPVILQNAESQFNVACSQVEMTLARTLRPPESLLTMASRWITTYDISIEQPEHFNQLFLPLLQQFPYLTSVVAGTDTGEGWMLMQLPDGRWRNRITDLPRWGEEQLFLEWFEDDPPQERREVVDYDPRQRPWFKTALAAENEGQPQWTAPYTFFTTQEPGITVATYRTLDNGRKMAIGLDIKLLDISKTSSTVELGKEGQLVVMTEDGRVLGLPRSVAWQSELLLQPAEKLPISQLQAGLATWRLAGRPEQQILRFDADGRAWLATFKPFVLSGTSLWIALVAPEADFLPPWQKMGQALGAILVVILSLTLLASRKQAQRFSKPLESLVADSERIAQLDFNESPHPSSNYKEFQRLEVAHGRMRGILKEFQQSSVAQANTLRHALDEKDAILDNALVGIALIKDRRIVRHNKKLAEILGFDGEVLVDAPTEPFYPDQATYLSKGQQVFEALSRGESFVDEHWLRRKDGHLIWTQLSGRAVDPNDFLAGSVWILADLTEQKAAEDRLHYLGHHDPLTGLANRHLFNDRLEHAILRAQREKEQLALLFIDLDHFKVVNDTLGHQVGDKLLCAMARRLASHLRSADTLARMGGDEFIILVEGVTDPGSLVHMAEKLVETFAAPVELEQRQLVVTGSIGISLYPADGLDAKTLIRNADAAMYQAKAQGRNTYHFYSEEMTRTALRRMEMEGYLRQGLEKSWLELHFQPQINLIDGSVIGAEALVRLRHPEKGLIPPLEFIGLAEETGLIFPLGQWVIEESCRTWIHLHKQGLRLPRLAVNLSAKQLQRNDFQARVTETLKATGMPAGVLEMEITESVFLESEKALELLSALGSLGINLSIDDFGTGYSSLSYLKRLPFGKIKIDRSFVRDIGLDEESETLARTIINMAHTLGLEAIAEGVETREQIDFLLAAGCLEAQGFYFAKPLPKADFQAWLKERIAPTVEVD